MQAADAAPMVRLPCHLLFSFNPANLYSNHIRLHDWIQVFRIDAMLATLLLVAFCNYLERGVWIYLLADVAGGFNPLQRPLMLHVVAGP